MDQTIRAPLFPNLVLKQKAIRGVWFLVRAVHVLVRRVACVCFPFFFPLSFGTRSYRMEWRARSTQQFYTQVLVRMPLFSGKRSINVTLVPRSSPPFFCTYPLFVEITPTSDGKRDIDEVHQRGALIMEVLIVIRSRQLGLLL